MPVYNSPRQSFGNCGIGEALPLNDQPIDAAMAIVIVPSDKEESIYTLAVFPESPYPPEYAYQEDIEFDAFWIGAETLNVKPLARFGDY